VNALVIDDSPSTRIYVRALLERWGYETSDASEGLEGLARIREANIRIVVCDWMMPGMSGPDLCRAVRSASLGRYVYFILLTGRSERTDLLDGLNAGADDFLSKPLDAQVLRARLRVAERILGLEDRLADQNRELRDSRNQLARAYDQIQTDLTAAARIQRQMLPTSDRPLYPLRAEWLFLPAAQVSGDGFNFFDLRDDLVGFYHLDVSGHGIPAALLSASLSRSLVPGFGPGVAAQSEFLEPAQFLAALNSQLRNPDGEVENYATVAYGTLDKRSGIAEIALAGHPRPIVVRGSGQIAYLRPGGLPVGMFPEVVYETQRLRLDPGDKLILYSDGVTECANPEGDVFGDARLQSVLENDATASGCRLTDALGSSLREWRGAFDFDDDISVLVLERPRESGLEPGHDSAFGPGTALEGT
jgi:sigma-B regulation protein RsbU (phosphoserine phosphatase)